MDRPTQRDVLLALLAYDAYNRGSNLQLRYGNGDKDDLSDTIGNATLDKQSDKVLGQPAIDTGFSASSYTLDSGETVISYRGTDFNFNSIPETIAFLSDVIEGWLPSIGVAAAETNGTKRQPAYAIEFYDKRVARIAKMCSSHQKTGNVGRHEARPGCWIFGAHFVPGRHAPAKSEGPKGTAAF